MKELSQTGEIMLVITNFTNEENDRDYMDWKD